jgi:hypothetical protein
MGAVARKRKDLEKAEAEWAEWTNAWQAALKVLQLATTATPETAEAQINAIDDMREAAGRARITDFILYDDLDPHALDTGIVRFDGRYFGTLWDICKQRGVSVVADVHVHPFGAGQSGSDREHPMISRAGHVAFILPNFARPPVPTESVGIYRYLGGKRWQTVPDAARRIFFHIGL